MRGESAVVALGAQAIHCGTAFLTTIESVAHDTYKARVLAAPTENTVYTDVYDLTLPHPGLSYPHFGGRRSRPYSHGPSTHCFQ